MKKSFALIAGVALSTSIATSPPAFADSIDISKGSWAWHCPLKQLWGALDISYADGKIVYEQVHKYPLIVDGRKLDKDKVGHEVIKVKTTDLELISANSVAFGSSFRGYDFEFNWNFRLNAIQAADSASPAYSAIMGLKYKNKFVDSKYHHINDTLECKVTQIHP